MSPQHRFAEGTSVTPERSQAEISETLRKYGATGFAFGWQDQRAMIAFSAHDRSIRFLLDLPHPNDREFKVTATGRSRQNPDTAYEGEIRRRWRSLALAIKAKLEAVATGITTFEDEFMAHIVLPDGTTVGERVSAELIGIWKQGHAPPSLLPTFPKAIESRKKD